MKNDCEKLKSLYKRERAKFIKAHLKVNGSILKPSRDKRFLEAFYNECIYRWNQNLKYGRPFERSWNCVDKKLISFNFRWLDVEAVLEFFVSKGFDKDNLVVEEIFYNDGGMSKYLSLKFS